MDIYEVKIKNRYQPVLANSFIELAEWAEANGYKSYRFVGIMPMSWHASIRNNPATIRVA